MGRLSSGPFHAPEGGTGGEAPSKAQRNASGRKGSSSAICVAGVGFASSPVIRLARAAVRQAWGISMPPASRPVTRPVTRSPEQMKMALTRLGFGSKIVVTGDISQIDLPRGESGLVQVRSVLEGIDDIAFCDLSGKDVVRHSLVATIVAAYERAAGKAR